MKFEVGFDFTNDWKGLFASNNYEEAVRFYLHKYMDEYDKLLDFSNSLCLKDKENDKKYHLVFKEK